MSKMDKQIEPARQALWERIVFLISKNWSSHLQMAGLTLMLLTIQIWQISGYGRLSLSVFLMGIICLCEASFASIRFKQDLQRQFQRNTIFLLVLEMISMLYLLINSRDIMSAIGIGGEILFVLGLGFVIVAQIVQLHHTEYRWRLRKKVVKEILLLGTLCFVFGFLMNIEIFNTWPRWDSYLYYNSFEKLAPKGIFMPGQNGLRACGHISTSYSLWSLLFASIPGITNLNAMYLSNMALISISIVLFYRIFKYLYPDNHFILNALYSIVCVVSPPLFGLSAEISVELILAVGVLSLIYSIFISNSILAIVSLFVVVTAKETGVLVAVTVVFVQLLYDVYQWIKDKKIQDSSRLTYYCLCLSLGISWLLQFSSGHWGDGGNTNHKAIQDGVEFFQFALSKIHIQDTLIGSLLLNFNWIFSLFIILAACLFIVRLIQKKMTFSYSFHNKENVIISTAFISYTIELCIYVTYHFPRYYITTAVLLSILGLGSLQYILKTVCNKKLLRLGMPIFLCGLFAVESYMTIDPVARTMYEGISTGKSVVVPVPIHSNYDIDPSLKPNACYNRMIMYFDKALDKAFAAIYGGSSSSEAKILFSDEYIGSIKDGKVSLGTLYCIWGFGYSYFDPPMWCHWNSDGNYRYLSYEQENNVDPSYIKADSDLSYYTNNYERVYYIKMPWGDPTLESLIEKYPSINYDQTVEYRGWVLEIYRIK